MQGILGKVKSLSNHVRYCTHTTERERERVSWFTAGCRCDVIGQFAQKKRALLDGLDGNMLANAEI